MAISQKLPEGFQTVTAYLTIREGEKLNERSFKSLVRAAVALNTTKKKRK